MTTPAPTRRAVAIATAWAVPAVAVAVAAPFAAASPVPTPTPTPTPLVPGQPDTYPDATYSETSQLYSNPSLRSSSGTGYARTLFRANTDGEDFSSYKTGWTYVITSAKPLAGITYDTTSLSPHQQGVVVDGLYTYSWYLTHAVESTWARVKPTAFPQAIQFTLNDTTAVPQVVVGEATATTQP
ncbi:MULTISPECIES: hypothetical protein [unclassified Rathayibacter]|uniref:hypothetical protein n=1 Tax=unclassified Rathayibacter TaxID=2609250 RepID=UPI00188D4388|nr:MULTISPECIES: hypothetical protein [unclassified Rathayibacter]MBF4462891.1 hypothetical protein [Rathayibacter sp. VKM Ac-2879]MBF4504305.1 hypothetical protein [Rathayibacter sp. VKM Ac-2878]